jgi:hypothetical protein
MAWELVNTMGALAFGADAGLTSLKGNPWYDSVQLMDDLNGEIFPQVEGQGGGTWTLVWGPYVLSKWAGLRFNIVNAMYVAQQSETNNYIIGIAGTDFRSLFDWLVEDFDITPITWPYADAGTIETGASIGLQKLQAMKPFPGMAQPGVPLIEYLSTITSSPINLYIAGHSLGGALTEVVAMWLADTQGADGWDPNSNATVTPFSYAGPTPGDPMWVAHFNETFQNGAAQRVWNTYDVVPHAWNAAQVAQIPDLYDGDPAPNDLVKLALDALLDKANKFTYVQVLGNGTPLEGTVQHDRDYLGEVLYQHVCAYYELLDIPPPAALAKTCNG